MPTMENVCRRAHKKKEKLRRNNVEEIVQNPKCRADIDPW
jgi:hypothetical protein